MTTPNQDIESLVVEQLQLLERFRIKRDRLTFPKESLVGRGGFAAVHLASLDRRIVSRNPGTAVAVKQLLPRTEEVTEFLQLTAALAREVSVWGPLGHPNILRFIGFHSNIPKKEAWLISAFAENGTVAKYIQTRQMDDMGLRLELVKDTISALQYMHSRSPPICHGDLKADNVLVNNQGRAMLCDLGLATPIGGAATGLTTTDFRRAGTIRYQCRELVSEGKPRSLETDIWAWGCLTLEICTGHAPYRAFTFDGAIANQIDSGAPPADIQETKLPDHVQTLLARCWMLDPSARPSATECLDVMAIEDRRAFKEKSLWESSTVVDVLERDLTAMLDRFDHLKLRKPLFTFADPGYRNKKGSVHRARLKRTLFSSGTDVAVKVFLINGVRSNCIRTFLSIVRELGVWSTLNHENILPLLGFYLSNRFDEAWFVSPFLAHGDVLGCINRNSLDLQARIILIRDVAEGLKYLHGLSPPLCHGDVKPDNILVDDDGRAVLRDFGLVRSMEGILSGLTTSTFNQRGSIAYHSPELFVEGSQRSPASDVWAWGCVSNEILGGQAPFCGIESAGVIAERIRDGEHPAVIPIHLPSAIGQAVSRCWKVDPTQRPSISTCILPLTTRISRSRYLSTVSLPDLLA